MRWKRERERRGARLVVAFVCCLWPKHYGSPVIRHTVRERFRTTCKPLGLERLRGFTVHLGWYTFVSHALVGGRTLAEVKAAGGVALLVTTSVYLHVAVDDDGVPGRLFDATSQI